MLRSLVMLMLLLAPAGTAQELDPMMTLTLGAIEVTEPLTLDTPYATSVNSMWTCDQVGGVLAEPLVLQWTVAIDAAWIEGPDPWQYTIDERVCFGQDALEEMQHPVTFTVVEDGYGGVPVWISTSTGDASESDRINAARFEQLVVPTWHAGFEVRSIRASGQDVLVGVANTGNGPIELTVAAASDPTRLLDPVLLGTEAWQDAPIQAVVTVPRQAPFVIGSELDLVFHGSSLAGLPSDELVQERLTATLGAEHGLFVEAPLGPVVLAALAFASLVRRRM